MDTWNEYSYFPTNTYTILKPEFLDQVKPVAYEYLEKIKSEYPINEMYPFYQTYNFYNDNRISDFSNYIVNTAWQILNSQGYGMQEKTTRFTSMWLQSHHKYSMMERHIHPDDSQIIGFYFLDTPENCNRMIIHDPRSAKVQISMQENDATELSYASNMIYFAPEPGMLYFINSWVPHSFSKNGSDDPCNFIHFNIKVDNAIVNIPPPAEVI
jgi:uncharacterized protein (TIGR02466 family)